MSIFKERVSKLIKGVNIDTVILTDPTNIFYFTGCFIDPHERLLALIIDVESEETTMMYPALDQEIVNDTATVVNHLPHRDGEDPFRLLFEQLGQGQGRSIGIEGNHLVYHRYMKLREEYSADNIRPIDDEVNALRGIKNEEDKAHLQEAVDITEKALFDLKEEGVIGKTEKEIADYLVDKLKSYGAVDVSFGPLVLTGENSALPHGSSGDTEVQQGDYLLIDFGIISESRYVSDMTRTFIIGEPTDEQREIYTAVYEANLAGIRAAVHGTPMNIVDKQARDVINDSGYGEFFTHRIGHGLGYGLHEQPSLDSDNKEELKIGHVVTVEPGIYQPGFGGVRIEDALYIGEETHNFNNFPKEIDEIILDR